MEHDTILCEKSEERIMDLLSRLEFNDFWMTFSYLKMKVGLSELQALSICIRKYDLKGAFDSNLYSHVCYTTKNYGYMNYDFFLNEYRREHCIMITFEKKDNVPQHLRGLHSHLLQTNNELILREIHRLTQQKNEEYSIELKDVFVIDILFSFLQTQLKENIYTQSGMFPLRDA
jgi:hypothetical protein